MFAQRLKQLRAENHMTQVQLAEMMDVSRQAISRWETGASSPTSENLKYLSTLYNVSLDYLILGNPNPTHDITNKLDLAIELLTSLKEDVLLGAEAV